MATSETVGHSAMTVIDAGGGTLAEHMERQEAWRRDDRNRLVEALEMATAEKTVLEEADRERHRLRPVSEWTPADGHVNTYRVHEDGTVEYLPKGLLGQASHFLRLPDPEKLCIG